MTSRAERIEPRLSSRLSRNKHLAARTLIHNYSNAHDTTSHNENHPPLHNDSSLYQNFELSNLVVDIVSTAEARSGSCLMVDIRMAYVWATGCPTTAGQYPTDFVYGVPRTSLSHGEENRLLHYPKDSRHKQRQQLLRRQHRFRSLCRCSREIGFENSQCQYPDVGQYWQNIRSLN